MLSRTLSSRDPVRADGDSGAFILPQTLNNARTNELGAALDLARGLRHPGGRQQRTGQGAPARAAGGREHPAHADVDLRSRRRSTRASTISSRSADSRASSSRRAPTPAGVSEPRVATLASGADLPLRHHLHAVPLADRGRRGYQRVGEAWSRDRDQAARVAGRQRALEPDLSRRGPLAAGRRRRHASAAAKGSSVQVEPQRAGGADQHSQSRSITPDVQLGFRNGMSGDARAQHARPGHLSNGNETRLDQNDITGSFNYAFRLPRSLSRARKQVRSSLVLSADRRQDLPRAGHGDRLHHHLRRAAPGAARRPRHRPAADAERRPPGRLHGQRRAASQPAHVADLDHRLVPALALRGRLSLTCALTLLPESGFHPAHAPPRPARRRAARRLPRHARRAPREFDGAAAFRYIETQVGFGPADPGHGGAPAGRRLARQSLAPAGRHGHRAVLDPRDRGGRLAPAHQLLARFQPGGRQAAALPGALGQPPDRRRPHLAGLDRARPRRQRRRLGRGGRCSAWPTR